MKKALIVYGGWQGHSPKEFAELVTNYLTPEGFSVESSDNLDSFSNLEDLKKLDLIIPMWTMGEISKIQCDAITEAVASGVGLGGFHGGMGDSFRISSAYQFMVGGQFVAHPGNIKKYSVEIVNNTDAITAGLENFEIESEQYYMHVDPGNEVLATTTFDDSICDWIGGTVMPVVWKRKFGKGKVFYSSIGHDPKEFDIPEVLEITKRGMLWATK